MNKFTKHYLTFIAVLVAILYLMLAFYNNSFNSVNMNQESKERIFGVFILFAVFGFIVIDNRIKE